MMDKNEKITRIKHLVDLLSKATYMYEQEDTEIMSNYEYDKLYDELVSLEQETGIVLAGSVTRKVGYEVKSSLPKIAHAKKMLSLDKTKDIEKLKAFLGKEQGLLSWKLDGLTIVCTYRDGMLLQAVTRGSGEIGEDVTSNARTFKNLPLTIPYKGQLIIRGEAIITYSDFEKINENLEGDEKYKNPRNLCSGSVRQLNSEITARRNVRICIFSLVEGGELTNYKKDQLEWLREQGFEVVEYEKVQRENIEETLKAFEDEITKRDFASDGLVLTYDDIAYSKSLGQTGKFPKDAIAFKWQDEVKDTKILNIEWNTSRTGLINPVAVFEPVEIEGTTVERASVHNLSILEELKIGIGDTVRVYKANMIIPQIQSNLTKSGPIAYPENCPVCGEHTFVKQDKNAKTLYCANPNCNAQKLKAFAHFSSRDAMNIEGLSEATIEKLLEKGFLEDFVSLYHLEEHADTIKQMEGFGEKSYVNLIASIEKSREIGLANFMYALGIMQVGSMNAKLICKYFEDDLRKIMDASSDEFTTIEGVGPVIAREIVGYFAKKENREMIERLVKELKFKISPRIDLKNMTSTIVGKTFVVTGDVMQFKNRKELQAKIEELGGKVTGSVSKNTDYLINNDSFSVSGKNKKAKELNVPIITEQEFLDIIQ